ncbi:hypothetical protein HMPREF0063_12888 [Aeromicrobium marinum DSM 15272]|uniref:Uncharacterized protein n=1 Tax=Aeromicrobium marinum DSM 15272 TaxID=585531 RepID=E2SFS9_9ACTN|nr:hypothetical protein [Aeromicrobium marinum]EFQ81981.1 hypothetical protein HMPREF0063_12888 [Aeromicrobium marinum DSM 15272]
MNSTHDHDTLTTADHRSLGWAVLAAAVLQVVAPLVTIAGPGSAPGSGGPDLLITPASWAFSIWGVIYALAVVHAVVVLVRGPGLVPRRLQIDQLVLYLGAAAWVGLAGLDSSVATAAALLVMTVAAVDGVVVAARAIVSPAWAEVLTRVTIGLYAGWVSVAVFLNLSTAAVSIDLLDATDSGWQIGVLVVAVATLVAVLLAAGANPAYAAAGVWAMVAITVAGGSDRSATITTIAVAAAVGLLVVVGAARRRLRGPRGIVP